MITNNFMKKKSADKKTIKKKSLGLEKKEILTNQKHEEKPREEIKKSDDKSLENEIADTFISNGFHESFNLDFPKPNIVLEKINSIPETNFSENISETAKPETNEGSRLYVLNSPQYSFGNTETKNSDGKYSDQTGVSLSSLNLEPPRVEMINPFKNAWRTESPEEVRQIRTETESPRKRFPFEIRDEKYKRRK